MPEPRFTAAAFLRDHAAVLVLGATCAAMVGTCCLLLGVGEEGALAMAGIVVLALAAGLAVEYLRRRRFWQDTSQAIDLVERSGQYESLVDEPAFLEGRLAHSMAERLEQMANTELSDLQDANHIYRDYIELWVHETKAPLAAARSMASRVQGESVDTLESLLEQLENQVEQALYCARSSTLQNDYLLREVPLAATVREACKRHARFLIDHGTIPRICIDDDLAVIADEGWLVFVLGQIAVNSAQYEATELRFTARVEDPETSRERTVLEIRDNGIGIAPEDMPRIFDRGFTGRNGRHSGTATGMGLYLVATLCASMGLGVCAASEQGEGTRVMITFPHDRRHKL